MEVYNNHDYRRLTDAIINYQIPAGIIHSNPSDELLICADKIKSYYLFPMVHTLGGTTPNKSIHSSIKYKPEAQFINNLLPPLVSAVPEATGINMDLLLESNYTAAPIFTANITEEKFRWYHRKY